MLALIVSQAGISQILPSFGGSRSGTAGMQFLKLGPDARSNAMAGSVVGNANDASAVFWNPAGAVELDTQRFHLQTGHTQYFGGINMNHGAFIWQPEKYRSFGFAIMNLQSPEMDVTTEFMPFGTGQTYFVNDLLMAFTYSQVLTDNFRFGVALKYANENIAGVVTQSGLFDFGFQYQIDVRDIMFGVTVSNFGVNVRPEGNVELITFQGRDTVSQFEEIAVPATFRLGFSGNIFKRKKSSLITTLQLNHPTDNRETVSWGFEYAFKELLFVRTGYWFGQRGAYPTFGMGVNLQRRFGRLSFDYAFVARQALGAMHQLTLGISAL